MAKYLVFVSFLIFHACSAGRPISDSVNQKVEVYQINQFSSFLIAINCVDIKSKFENRRTVIDGDEVAEFQKLKTLATKATKSDLGNSIDTRLSIEFIEQDSVKHRMCWSMAGFSFDGVVYLPSAKVDSLLASKKLIVSIR